MIEYSIDKWQRLVISGDFGKEFDAEAAATALRRLRAAVILLRAARAQAAKFATQDLNLNAERNALSDEIDRFLEGRDPAESGSA